MDYNRYNEVANLYVKMIELYTDACLYNGVGGIGIYSTCTNIFQLSTRKIYPGMTTQSLELDAIHSAFSRAGAYKNVVIYTDSTYSFDNIVTNGDLNEARGWKTTTNKLMHCASQLQVCYKALRTYGKKNKNIRLSYCKGHSGIYGNEQADKLAGMAAGKYDSQTNTVGEVHGNDVAPDTVSNKEQPLVANTQGSGIKPDNTEVPARIHTGLEEASSHSESSSDSMSSNEVGDQVQVIVSDMDEDENYGNMSAGKKSKKKLKKLGFVFEEPLGPITISAPKATPTMLAGELKMMTNLDSVVGSLAGTNTANESAEQSDMRSQLYLSCIQCTDTIAIGYPKHDAALISEYADAESSVTFALTKCRQCIMGRTVLRTVSHSGIKMESDALKCNEMFTEMKLSTRMVFNSPAHAAVCRLTSSDVPILSINGQIKFVPVTIVTSLCGKGTRCLTIDVEEAKSYGYLENGFI